MQRWLIIVAVGPLAAATAVHAESKRPFDLREPAPIRHGRTIDLRLVQEPSLNRVDPPSTGLAAETEVAPNTRIGFRMMNVSRPPLGPEWRIDGRSTRSRKPAVSVTLRF